MSKIVTTALTTFNSSLESSGQSCVDTTSIYHLFMQFVRLVVTYHLIVRLIVIYPCLSAL